ncbi:hypothetical protein [Streptomyces spongiae]|uniref:hypothetical protein n=1 Tax=Streptomyces spongiae TaxID=565072 RepID=UPI002AD29BC4|nr:hypothetical protein [Streptomyces spongiae]
MLLRLLEPDARAAWFWLCFRTGGVPDDVADAIVAHPDHRVRGILAENMTADPAQRARMADDPEVKVRRALAMGPEPFRAEVEPLPDAAYERLLSDPDSQVRAWTAQSREIPNRLLAGYADHADAEVRAAATRAWDELPPAARQALLTDPDAGVRTAAAQRVCHQDAARTDELLGVLDGWERELVLGRGLLTRATAERLACGEDDGDRGAVALNPSLPPDLVDRLARDPEHWVRRVVSARPELTEEQRAAIDYRVESDERLTPLDWVLAIRDDPEALRRCATSAHIWLRRSAAVHPRLPSDLVDRLATDDDFAVRLLTCEFQPAAPAEALLGVFLEWQGITRSVLLSKPQFPRRGLARYADHDEPGLRRLAVHDPDATPELIERLSRDEFGIVRAAAAKDSRLSPERIEELLKDFSAAQSAAANPALPAEVMHRWLDTALS